MFFFCNDRDRRTICTYLLDIKVSGYMVTYFYYVNMQYNMQYNYVNMCMRLIYANMYRYAT